MFSCSNLNDELMNYFLHLTGLQKFMQNSNIKLQVATGIFNHRISDHLATFCKLGK